VSEKQKISVYLDDGRVFEYEVDGEGKGREHSHAIAMTGYRHTCDGVLEHYPPHRILKIKVTGQNTSFPDSVRGT
jgi:hypothetical protein